MGINTEVISNTAMSSNFINTLYVGYTELTCIPDLGLNADIEGQVLSLRSLVCVSMYECVPPCMLN